MTVYLQDTDLTLHHGDCLEVLRTLPDRSVHMCATSPPFYGLRDYGTGEWEGGNPDCDHKAPSRFDYAVSDKQFSNTGSEQHATFRSLCGKCGARRVDQQIGLEETPDQWVERLVAVFREVRRVLRDDGTLWVEIGDSYCANQGAYRADEAETKGGVAGHVPNSWGGGQVSPVRHPHKPKDLLGQPWLLAFALRADGWYLRSEIIWARPNPMPESVTDRPTKSHSTVFLLSKRPRYFYDADAIREAFSSTNNRGNRIGFRGEDSYTQGKSFHNSGDRVKAGGNTGDSQYSLEEKLDQIRINCGYPPFSEGVRDEDGRVAHGPGVSSSAGSALVPRLTPSESGDSQQTLDPALPPESPRGPDGRRVTAVKGQENSEQHRDGERWPNPSGANARSVWNIPTEPTPFAHFATWPRKLVARMILAGTSERGCCPECGAPWVRETSEAHDAEGRTTNGQKPRTSERRGFDVRMVKSTATLGWSPSCSHYVYGDVTDEWDGPAPVPCTVLDPFAGSGTTLLVARQHGRHSIGIELNPAYCELVRDRTSQQSLLADAQ